MVIPLSKGKPMSTGIPTKIFDELRTQIINEKYPIGTKLPTERELAEHFEANRAAVREAIAMLSRDGFVETLPQSGTYVKNFYTDGSLSTLVETLRVRRTIDRQTLESLLQFRVTLETSAAEEAAARINARDIEFLSETLDRKETNPEDTATLTECDYAFHEKIILVSGNIINKLVFQSLRPIYSFFTSFFYSLPSVSADSLTLNRSLVSALKKGDGPAAAKAMNDILSFGANALLNSIDKREQLIVIPK